MIDLTVSLVLYRQCASELAMCLHALNDAWMRYAAMAPGACCQVCVVLNDEPDTPDARRILERLDTDASGYAFALCRVLGHGNVGFGRGHNLALAHSPAHHHLILNADVVLSPDYIVEHMRFMQAHADVVLLTPQGFGLRDEPLYLAKRYPSWTVLLGRFVGERRLPSAWARRLAHYRYADQGVPAQAVDIDIASGCCMFVRGEALRQCGGFDERYFLYFEDFDLSLRLARWGRVVQLPVKIRHAGGEAGRKGGWHVLLFLRSALRFFATHGFRW